MLTGAVPVPLSCLAHCSCHLQEAASSTTSTRVAAWKENQCPGAQRVKHVGVVPEAASAGISLHADRLWPKTFVVSAHRLVWIQLQAERLLNQHPLARRQVLQGDIMSMPILPYA